ncbi:hypothetical protein SEVIR_6G195050v4 [Setaria viridis]|uniref:Uncharacterized protein n=1 Tax=Setaria viridis TaxID=4556 RepID=A0A4U6U8F9_SETVI|nr:hypothetical protein SEVIR_6G195050v2 [Setaria viridis]
MSPTSMGTWPMACGVLTNILSRPSSRQIDDWHGDDVVDDGESGAAAPSLGEGTELGDNMSLGGNGEGEWHLCNSSLLPLATNTPPLPMLRRHHRLPPPKHVHTERGCGPGAWRPRLAVPPRGLPPATHRWRMAPLAW